MFFYVLLLYMNDYEKNLLMYYNTSLRNIFLTMGTSFGCLGYSRFYRGKQKIYNITLIVIAIIVACFSMFIAKNLVLDIKQYLAKKKAPIVEKWLMIPETMVYVQIVLILLAFFTLYRELF